MSEKEDHYNYFEKIYIFRLSFSFSRPIYEVGAVRSPKIKVMQNLL